MSTCVCMMSCCRVTLATRLESQQGVSHVVEHTEEQHDVEDADRVWRQVQHFDGPVFDTVT